MANSRISISSIVQGFPKSKSLLAGNDAIYTGSYESIATVTVGAGGASSIDFTSIPATYTHLQIRGIVKNNSTSTTADANGLQFNSDTATNYNTHYIQGDGASAVSGGVANLNFIYAGYCARSNASYTSMFGVSVIDILDYADTNKYKTVRTLSGVDMNGSGYSFFSSGAWRSTSAITSIKLFISGNNYVQYSTFALYGIK